MILNQKDVQLSQLTASKAEAEVASLHARINPHFLYNSLNSIAGLAHSDADKTEKMAVISVRSVQAQPQPQQCPVLYAGRRSWKP